MIPVTSRPEHGAVAVIAAITTSAVLFIVGAMAVDLGDAFARRESLQTSADLAALAGARELPDIGRARSAAIASLCDRAASENTVAGWPAGTCSSRNWADDGDLRNGEIEFFAADSNANGFLDDGTAPAGVTRSGSAGDERVTSGPATSLRVVTAPATVRFHLAAAVGVNSVTLQRAATSTTATPAGPRAVAPFYLVDGQDEDPQVCFWFGGPTTPAPSDRSACDASRANRGFVDAPRWVGGGGGGAIPAPQANLQFGLDRSVVPWTAYPVQPANPAPPAATSCAAAAGTATTFGAAAPARTPVNCLPLATASLSRAATDAFLNSGTARLRPEPTCPGRTNTISLGLHSGLAVNSLFQQAFMNATNGAQVADLAAYYQLGKHPAPFPTSLRGALSSAILGCPQLALVPVVSLPNTGPDGPRVPPAGGTYPVVGMRYVWFGDDSPFRCCTGTYYQERGFVFSLFGNRLIGIKAYVIDPRLLPETVTGSPTLNAWTGPVWPGRSGSGSGQPISPGPRQLRLTHDSADPIPEAP